MWKTLRSLALAVLAPLVLASCLFVPGKFESALTIHRDRTFAFTYKGEVAAIDVKGLGGKLMKIGMDQSAKAPKGGKPTPPDLSALDLTPEEKAKRDETFRKLATELAKEAGYKSVEYRGDGIFYVDFSISGVLDHSFVYPYNLDNEIVFPWLAIELRGKDAVRFKAPGFARPKGDPTGAGGMGGLSAGMASLPLAGIGDIYGRMSGTFTLRTDAELLSQNNEEGAETIGSEKQIVWKVDTNTSDAPMASLRVTPLH